MFGKLMWLDWLPPIAQRQNNWNLTPIVWGVIQENGKTLNFCIIKTATNHVPADHPLKTRLFEHPKKPLESHGLGTIF
jgi:hypothetical protein